MRARPLNHRNIVENAGVSGSHGCRPADQVPLFPLPINLAV